MRRFVLPSKDYYQSIFKNEMFEYLSLLNTRKQLLRNEPYVLKSLDKSLIEYGETLPKLTEDAVLYWQKTLADKKSRTIAGYTSMVRQFGRYLAVLGYEVFIPELPKMYSDYVPYIFTQDEIHRIIDVCDNLVMDAGTNTPVVLPVLIRILYGCGLRLGEACNLKNKDVDLNIGILRITHAKGNKERLVPMDSSLTNICQQYYSVIHIDSTEDDYFLMQPNKKTYSIENINSHFKNILSLAKIEYARTKKYERGPCLHCLRYPNLNKIQTLQNKAA